MLLPQKPLIEVQSADVDPPPERRCEAQLQTIPCCRLPSSRITRLRQQSRDWWLLAGTGSTTMLPTFQLVPCSDWHRYIAVSDGHRYIVVGPLQWWASLHCSWSPAAVMGIDILQLVPCSDGYRYIAVGPQQWWVSLHCSWSPAVMGIAILQLVPCSDRYVLLHCS